MDDDIYEIFFLSKLYYQAIRVSLNVNEMYGENYFYLS